MKKVVVFGASGLLGNWLVSKFKLSDKFQIIKIGRSDDNDFQTDLTDISLLLPVLEKVNPDIILNLVAESNVDVCETDLKKAFNANVLIPFHISEYLKLNNNCKCVHISTDHVYEGEGLKTEEQVTLVNNYALTKFSGEKIFKDNTFILRTNFFGKSKVVKDSFSDWVVKSFKKNELFNLYEDSIITPVHWLTLYEVILTVFNSTEFGIYNVGSFQPLSKAEIAIQIAKKLNIYHENYKLVLVNSNKLIAKRPCNMSMNSKKLYEKFNFSQINIKTEIDKLVEEYINE